MSTCIICHGSGCLLQWTKAPKPVKQKIVVLVAPLVHFNKIDRNGFLLQYTEELEPQLNLVEALPNGNIDKKKMGCTILFSVYDFALKLKYKNVRKAKIHWFQQWSIIYFLHATIRTLALFNQPSQGYMICLIAGMGLKLFFCRSTLVCWICGCINNFQQGGAHVVKKIIVSTKF